MGLKINFIKKNNFWCLGGCYLLMLWFWYLLIILCKLVFKNVCLIRNNFMCFDIIEYNRMFLFILNIFIDFVG